jgi:hypothetical protein
MPGVVWSDLPRGHDSVSIMRWTQSVGPFLVFANKHNILRLFHVGFHAKQLVGSPTSRVVEGCYSLQPTASGEGVCWFLGAEAGGCTKILRGEGDLVSFYVYCWGLTFSCLVTPTNSPMSRPGKTNTDVSKIIHTW